MWTSEHVIAELRRRGELWETAPGLIGLRGDALALSRDLAQLLVPAAAGADWQVPPAIPFATLAQADYFASFPQWLTAASHLTDAEEQLARVAASGGAAAAIADAITPPQVALLPAVCYHVYAAYAGAVLGDTHTVVCQGTCWRHERDGLRPLERGWAFTMREVVCIGAEADVEAFRVGQLRRVSGITAALGLAAHFEVATDPFFAASARGRALLQRVKSLKLELQLALGDGRRTAAASFNNHETFFGTSYGIRTMSGAAASSACAAFGLERWLLAFLVAHGVDARAWPDTAAAAHTALEAA